MFETFNVPGIFIGNSGPLALYSSGRTTGVVCEAGDGVIHSVPVQEGVPIAHAI